MQNRPNLVQQYQQTIQHGQWQEPAKKAHTHIKDDPCPMSHGKVSSRFDLPAQSSRPCDPRTDARTDRRTRRTGPTPSGDRFTAGVRLSGALHLRVRKPSWTPPHAAQREEGRERGWERLNGIFSGFLGGLKYHCIVGFSTFSFSDSSFFGQLLRTLRMCFLLG